MKDNGTRKYTRWFLTYYDIEVLWLNNTFAWHCPTKTVQLPLYASAVGESHLEVGVGSGYYPYHALKNASSSFPSPRPSSSSSSSSSTPKAALACRKMTLVDLNAATLDFASCRIRRACGANVEVRSLLADALDPLPLPEDEKFDSISLFYLLHCIPLAPEDKARVFDRARERLTDDGVLVGTTILGGRDDGGDSNGNGNGGGLFTSYRLWSYNKRGIFHNLRDTREVFEAALRRNFANVEIDVVGSVMVWKATKPIR